MHFYFFIIIIILRMKKSNFIRISEFELKWIRCIEVQASFEMYGTNGRKLVSHTQISCTDVSIKSTRKVIPRQRMREHANRATLSIVLHHHLTSLNFHIKVTIFVYIPDSPSYKSIPLLKLSLLKRNIALLNVSGSFFMLNWPPNYLINQWFSPITRH